MNSFAIRGFNMCESILRHTPEQLRAFIRRMKTLQMNSLIVHYDYGWKRHHELIMKECLQAEVKITLMTFGPRTFFGYTPWKTQWFAKNEIGRACTENLECETHPCRFEQEGLEAFAAGAKEWLQTLPPQIRRIHMRAADGLMFCQCEKCCPLADHEKWQPFVELFIKTVKDVRPDLEYETDIYVKRYNIPANREPFQDMSHIMYDTFYRHPFFPIGSERDFINRESLLHGAATESNPDASTPNSYHLNRLSEWTAAFPGKTYIHENAMGQSYFGTFQHNTKVMLQDLELYRHLGISGVCYEAYEPGYEFFQSHFERLAMAMADPDSIGNYQETALERQLSNMGNMCLFCDDVTFPLEKYIDDPLLLRQARLYRDVQCRLSATVFRKYLDLAFEHPKRLDFLMIGFGMAKMGLVFQKLAFSRLSEQAEELLRSRKLWDFMERIPASLEPIVVTRQLIEEFYDKVENKNV